MAGRLARGAFAAFLGWMLAGCIPLAGWENRYGPDPNIVAEEVKATAARQREIVLALAYATHGEAARGEGHHYWYPVAQAGFLYIDEKCDAYLTTQFRLDRQRDRFQGLLTFLGAGTTAALAATSVDKATIGVVAQIFGFGNTLADAVAESYLFKDPTLVVNTVQKLRIAHWRHAARYPEAINSPAAVLASMRSYLENCLPPFIEARIKEAAYAASAGNALDTVVTQNDLRTIVIERDSDSPRAMITLGTKPVP